MKEILIKVLKKIIRGEIKIKIMMYIVVAIVVIFALMKVSIVLTNKDPIEGLINNKLPSLPDKPNCVSSYAIDEQKRMEPWELKVEFSQFLKEVEGDGGQIKQSDEKYVHFVYKTKIIGFIDDVEFLFDQKTKIIEFRSASRMGYSDFGVNRKRMEELEDKLRKKEIIK